jgi:hypothetical protein
VVPRYEKESNTLQSLTTVFEIPRPATFFPIKMWGLNTLFPGFAPGDFAVLHGSASVVSLCSLICVKAQLPAQLDGLNTDVIFVDGANTFQPYQIARLAKVHQMDPKKVLDHILLTRTFTAYQMTKLILQNLEEEIKRSNAKLVIISDIVATFLDDDIHNEEAKKIYNQIITKLSIIAKQYQTIIIATHLPHKGSQRDDYLKSLTKARASTIIGLHQSKYTREIALEKHPFCVLGEVELPTETMPLTHFMDAIQHQ